MKKLIILMICLACALMGMSQTHHLYKKTVVYSFNSPGTPVDYIDTGRAVYIDNQLIKLYINRNGRYFYYRESKKGRIYKSYLTFKQLQQL
jgi:hypothetical protein